MSDAQLCCGCPESSSARTWLTSRRSSAQARHAPLPTSAVLRLQAFAIEQHSAQQWHDATKIGTGEALRHGRHLRKTFQRCDGQLYVCRLAGRNDSEASTPTTCKQISAQSCRHKPVPSEHDGCTGHYVNTLRRDVSCVLDWMFGKLCLMLRIGAAAQFDIVPGVSVLCTELGLTLYQRTRPAIGLRRLQ